ncbi:MAG: type III pantothenate kinase [Magnetococcus sp. YQC-3]
MLLVIDIGNTNIVLGIYRETTTEGDGGTGQGRVLLHHWRIATRVEQTGDEYGILIANLFHLARIAPEQVKGAIVASVVPPIQSALVRVLKRNFRISPLLVGPGIKTGMPILCDNPREVGADRIVNAVAAFDRMRQAVIVVDFGTATTFDLVSERGEYLGGAIAPGLGLATKVLSERTAQLPSVDLVRPQRVIGRNTVGSMHSGLYWGYVGLVDGLVRRMIAESGFANVRVIATGGLARMISGGSECIELVDEYLTLAGLQLLYERNC